MKSLTELSALQAQSYVINLYKPIAPSINHQTGYVGETELERQHIKIVILGESYRGMEKERNERQKEEEKQKKKNEN